MFRYLDAFEDYNPLKDKLPEPLFWEIGYIEQQAKSLLPKDFTLTDLNACLEIIFHLKKYSSLAAYNHHENFDEDLKANGVFHSPPLECFLSTDYVENEGRAKDQLYEWSWVFATWSLASNCDYIDAKTRSYKNENAHESIPETLADKVSDSYALGHMHELPIEATEALGFARLFAEREEIAEKGKTKRQKIAQGTSKQKLDSYHPLKLAIITEFSKLDPNLSYRKAAATIYENLHDKAKASFMTDDPTHQIEKWLSQYVKGTLPGQDRLPPYQP